MSIFMRTTARQAFCCGSAYLRVGEITTAINECQQAVALYKASPPEERWYAAESSTHADLAAAYLQQQNLDGAHDALVAVFSLPPQQRVKGLVRRMSVVNNLLAQPPYEGSHRARELGEQIEYFISDTIIPSLASGLG